MGWRKEVIVIFPVLEAEELNEVRNDLDPMIPHTSEPAPLNRPLLAHKSSDDMEDNASFEASMEISPTDHIINYSIVLTETRHMLVYESL